MIVEALVSAVVNAIERILDFLPPLPSFPDTLDYSINRFLDLVFDNAALLDIFLPINLIKVCALTMISLLTFCYLFSVFRSIVKTFKFNL